MLNIPCLPYIFLKPLTILINCFVITSEYYTKKKLGNIKYQVREFVGNYDMHDERIVRTIWKVHILARSLAPPYTDTHTHYTHTHYTLYISRDNLPWSNFYYLFWKNGSIYLKKRKYCTTICLQIFGESD